MHAHHTALGIASLGRHGDDMIVHMNRDEVQGLQALAQQHGTSLSINPHTGMPEAFKLGNVFKALLPMAAGFALGPGGFFGGEGLFGSALMTGLAVGAGTGLLTGNLGQGLMAGLGAYGGFDLSKAWNGMGGTDAFKNANIFNQAQAAPNTMAEQALKGGAGTANLAGGVGNIGPNLGLVNTGSNIFDASATAIPADYVPGGPYMPSNVAEAAKPIAPDLGTVIKNTPTAPAAVSKTIVPDSGIKGVWDAYKANDGSALKLATAIGGPVVQGFEQSDSMPNQNPNAQEYTKRVPTGQYDAQGNPIYTTILQTAYSPNETLNLNDPYKNYPNVKQPPALQLPPTVIAKEGGEVHSYAVGGPVTTTGVQSLYSSPDGTNAQNTPMDAYGIGRLNSLANAEAMNTAKTFGYANGGVIALAHGGTPQAGGYLDGQGDGMSDSIPATIEGKQPARLADGEFVVPADVVSHIGNGSSKAGSKRLYAMLDKVRQARTGHVKQGKQINPNQYLPA